MNRTTKRKHEQDLADRFIDWHNQQTGRSYQFSSRPEDDNRSPENHDFDYTDPKISHTLAIEIIGLMQEERIRSDTFQFGVLLVELRKRVEQKLPGRYRIMPYGIDDAPRKIRSQLVDEMGKAILALAPRLPMRKRIWLIFLSKRPEKDATNFFIRSDLMAAVNEPGEPGIMFFLSDEHELFFPSLNMGKVNSIASDAKKLGVHVYPFLLSRFQGFGSALQLMTIDAKYASSPVSLSEVLESWACDYIRDKNDQLMHAKLSGKETVLLIEPCYPLFDAALMSSVFQRLNKVIHRHIDHIYVVNDQPFCIK